MKKSFSFLIVFLLIGLSPVLVFGDLSKNEKIVFAVLEDGNSSRFDQSLDGLKNKIKKIAGFNREIIFPEKYIVSCNFDPEKVKITAQKFLEEKDVDIIIAAGPAGSSVFGKIKNLKKPVIAFYFVEPEVFSPGFNGKIPQKNNLYYIKSFPSIFSSIEAFYELVKFSEIQIIAEPYIADLFEIKKESDFQNLNYRVSILKTSKDLLKTIENLNEKTDAVLISPLTSCSWEDFEIFINELNKKNIYTFSLYGHEEIKKGCLAGLRNSFINESSERMAGLLSEKIISGIYRKNHEEAFLNEPELEINMDIAGMLGVSPDFNIFLKAKPYYSDKYIEENNVNLEEIIDFSIKNNSLMQASQKETNKSEFDRKIAKSYILPQAGIIAEGIRRDEDSSYSSFGQYPENEINLKFYIRQAIFDDEVFTGLKQSKKALAATKEKERAKRLETAANTASAYFRHLSAVKIREIRRNDLELSKANLLKAKTKHEVGTKGPGDVFRWESMTADAKKELLNALKRENQALIKLEKITGRKFNETNVFTFPELDSKFFWVDEKTFEKISKNRSELEKSKDVLGKFAIENSPELGAYTNLIEAQKKQSAYLVRKHFIPKVYLTGQYLQRVARSGAGADGVSFDIAPGMPPFEIDSPKDNSWQIGVEAVLPIFTGLRDKNSKLKSDEELTRLQIIRNDALENIEENLSLLIDEAAYAHLSISFAEESKNAAFKNFELVSDAYELGLADSVDLIDAQHSYTAAEEVLSASLYEFMEKIYLIQARLGFVDFSKVPEKKEKIIELIRRK
jgi:outer membrane protein